MHVVRRNLSPTLLGSIYMELALKGKHWKVNSSKTVGIVSYTKTQNNISRNARSKGIDNCCGLYIRVYFRITPIENEWRFINLIAI